MSNRTQVRGVKSWFYKKVRGLCWLEDMTALACRFDCVGLKIRLRWLEEVYS